MNNNLKRKHRHSLLMHNHTNNLNGGREIWGVRHVRFLHRQKTDWLGQPGYLESLSCVQALIQALNPVLSICLLICIFCVALPHLPIFKHFNRLSSLVSILTCLQQHLSNSVFVPLTVESSSASAF